MKKSILLILAASLWLAPLPSQAADSAKDPKGQLKELVGEITDQLKAGKKTEAELAESIKKFDVILAQHKDEKTDDVAEILFMKAMLFLQVFDNEVKGAELINQLKKDFPETNRGKAVDQILAQLKQQEAAKKIQRSLAVGTVFPDFKETDLDGKPLSVGNFKGKVVLVDFWATWCGPCVGELPNVLKTYEKFHAKGFEIIGISLDKEKDKLTGFLKEKGMTWAQYFDGKGWQSKLAGQYGVNSIPATYLIDTEGKILAKDLRGEALEKAVEKALTK